MYNQTRNAQPGSQFFHQALSLLPLLSRKINHIYKTMLAVALVFALARALLRKPGVLILDEATSNLDSENERRIQEAIDALHGGITIVIITHRFSTIRNAGVIHVIENGRIIESGDWASLTARETGRFRRLCEAQDALQEADDMVLDGLRGTSRMRDPELTPNL